MMSTSHGSKSVSSALAVLCTKDAKHFIFEDKVIIGRSPIAFLCIADNRISRNHCVIEKTGDQKFTITDLSNCGTYVNGKSLIKNQPQELKHHDSIKIANLDDFAYVFLINKMTNRMKMSTRVNKAHSPLTKKMIDLNETQSMEKDSMGEELNLVETEMCRLKEELQQKLKAKEEELERERLKVSLESAYNKEQNEKAQLMLRETMEEKEKIVKEYEEKISFFSKQAEVLLETKDEMEKRHKIEREEFEKKCRSEIEDLKKELGKSETKHKQFVDLQARLEEVTDILVNSELEQQRLFEEKVQAETKLESKIVDLTNERENKVEQVKELTQKLKEKEELEERVKREIEGLEDDMMCSICAELYLEPTALNCGHMFCKLCITEWSKKKNICPMCRAKIVTKIRLFNMDSVIQRNVSLMSEEVQTRRKALIAEREKGKAPKKRHSAKKRRREVSPVNTPAPHDTPAPHGLLRPSNFTLNEPEGDDPFQFRWVHLNPAHRIQPVVSLERGSPVPVAAVDLTDLTVIEGPFTARARTHTVTSADANTTIDLTNL